jgi:very-short-patch-repair endonuclease
MGERRGDDLSLTAECEGRSSTGSGTVLRRQRPGVKNRAMRLLSEIVNSLGGMAQKQQLVRRGASDHDLTRAVRAGEVTRVRNGWYSTMDEESAELRAVRVGGRLTGISAVQAMGGWTLGDHPLHVAVHDNASRLRTQRNRHQRLDVRSTGGVVLHWTPHGQRELGTAVRVGLVDALERVVLDETFETAVAALDWALRTGQLDIVDLETLVLRLPLDRRGIRDWVDGTCDSLPESLARTRLRLGGHTVRTQQGMSDGRTIDLVVDNSVAIEIDGDAYHRDRFEADRAKDVDITLMGLHALRPTARTVFRRWRHFEQAVEVALAARSVPSREFENSGDRRAPSYSSRGITAWTRGPRRRTPEFSRVGMPRRRE